ncbi:MAG: hypothetical protein HFI65_00740 [Lachnospiraceae bacterium]|nr:hypothetical protein [Lachnospiraceae bacterium]
MDELAHVIGGRSYRINRYLTVYTPRLYEIMEFGEGLYFQVLNLFTRKPYDIAVELYDNGIDYQELTDYDLFFDGISRISPELSCILFGRTDFTAFRKYVRGEDGRKLLVHREDPGFVIDEAVHRQIVSYLRYIHFISEQVEYDAGNAAAKRFLIDRMRRKRKKLARECQNGRILSRSGISDMIKYCVNSPGFKYDYTSVMELPLSLLYESYYFITYGRERDHVLSGIYHGTIDSGKMKNKQIWNPIPDLHK